MAAGYLPYFDERAWAVDEEMGRARRAIRDGALLRIQLGLLRHRCLEKFDRAEGFRHVVKLLLTRIVVVLLLLIIISVLTDQRILADRCAKWLRGVVRPSVKHALT